MRIGASRTAPRTGPRLTIFLRSTRSASSSSDSPTHRGIVQAFAFNARRDKFKDARVRHPFNFAFDFKEMNKQFFFGHYKRINRYSRAPTGLFRVAAGGGA